MGFAVRLAPPPMPPTAESENSYGLSGRVVGTVARTCCRVVRSAPGTEARGNTYREKVRTTERQLFNGLVLKAWLVFGIGWLYVSDFLHLRHSQA